MGKTLAALAMVGAALGAAIVSAGPQPGGTEMSGVLDVTMTSIEGQQINLNTYLGKVVLIVNVASRCGYTPQYEGLQSLHERYAGQGLAILGFPSNDFGGQEPGSNAEIIEFCQANYGVEFDMFSTIAVKGPNKVPLYDFLTSAETNPVSSGEVEWNFEKFLVSREGEILERFRSPVEPESGDMVSAIEDAL
jgi:glutathione peroxidase